MLSRQGLHVYSSRNTYLGAVRRSGMRVRVKGDVKIPAPPNGAGRVK
jgi:hypothetical protein